MKFIVTRYVPYSKPEPNVCYLTPADWDDWFEFETTFTLTYFDAKKGKHNIGALKMGRKGMKGARSNGDSYQRHPTPYESFQHIGKDYFSVGQDASYYERLNNLGDVIRDEILNGLNDLAKHERLFEEVVDERVTRISLLRYITATSVRGQFRRLSEGGAALSNFEFTYFFPYKKELRAPEASIHFQVAPESNPPTNVHVLIGRNGVGKTFLMNNMIASLVEKGSPAKVGQFKSSTTGDVFANVVSVTFSAFDATEPPPEKKNKGDGIRFTYVGLKRNRSGQEVNLVPKSPIMLKNEFVKSIDVCNRSSKLSRWKRVIEVLEDDSNFKEAGITKILDEETTELRDELAGALFNKLSSGHKIVLLTMTRLVESLEERSLVLIDEPEAHLHPPLLSAFMRALSDLLMLSNAVCIIATHSPVVLQEVPKSCVWTLRRSGTIVSAERLKLESFGENVGSLTREVFGLEVTYSGFHKLLSNAVHDDPRYESVVNEFDGQLGMEARAILRGMIIDHTNKGA